MVLFSKMARAGGVSQMEEQLPQLEFTAVPVPFWFCETLVFTTPLHLQYHEVKLTCHSPQPPRRNNARPTKLYAEYVYLDTEERRRFAQVSHEYLIEQVQHQSQSSATTLLNLTSTTQSRNSSGLELSPQILPTSVFGHQLTHTSLEIKRTRRFSARPGSVLSQEHRYGTPDWLWWRLNIRLVAQYSP